VRDLHRTGFSFWRQKFRLQGQALFLEEKNFANYINGKTCHKFSRFFKFFIYIKFHIYTVTGHGSIHEQYI
jgi:hypothetical protein